MLIPQKLLITTQYLSWDASEMQHFSFLFLFLLLPGDFGQDYSSGNSWFLKLMGNLGGRNGDNVVLLLVNSLFVNSRLSSANAGSMFGRIFASPIIMRSWLATILRFKILAYTIIVRFWFYSLFWILWDHQPVCNFWSWSPLIFRRHDIIWT